MTRTHLSIVLLMSGLWAGCAATIPAELANARRAYAAAANGQASQLVPAEVHKAHQSLAEAEESFRRDPRGYHTKDLAYVAQRKAELADAMAAQAVEATSTAASNSQYQATQDTIMRDTKERLGASQSDLAASQAVAAQTAAQLTASERARAIAEARTAEALSALAKLAAVKEEARGLVITLSGSVLFRTDEATLLPEAQTRLGQVADALLATKERNVVVEGHTDSQGSDEHNQELSQRRAETVRAFLITRGYAAGRVTAVGIGEARPIADNATAEGRANNRRVEIVIQPMVAAQ